MLSPAECDKAAEQVIATYCQTCQVATPDDVRKAGEMLISKMARGIEKYSGTDQAVSVLQRTLLHVSKEGGAA